MRKLFTALALASALPWAAQAQPTNALLNNGLGQRWAILCTNLAVTNGYIYTNSPTNSVFKGTGMSFMQQYQGSNSLQTNTYRIDFCVDETNWSTTNTLQWTWIQIGSNWYYTNFLADQFNNAKWWRLGWLQAGSMPFTNTMEGSVIP